MRFCATPGCPETVDRGHCDEHRRRREAARPTAATRGYDQAWARYSRDRLRRLPWCGQREDGSIDAQHSRCAQDGLKTLARCTDHIVPMSAGGSKWNASNHLSLCIACNSWKAGTIERKARKHRGGPGRVVFIAGATRPQRTPWAPETHAATKSLPNRREGY